MTASDTDAEPTTSAAVPPQATGARIAGSGAAERTRKRNLVVLALLALLLLTLCYVAYYYTMNRRLPVPEFVERQRTSIEAPRFLYAFSGRARQAMQRPTGILVSGDEVFVTDYASRSIRVYTRAGGYLREFSAVRDGKNTRLSAPVHLAMDPDGRLWVTDRRLKGVYVFERDGTFVRAFDPGAEIRKLWSPLAIAFSADGTLYLSDVGQPDNHRILVFRPDGTLIREWGGTTQVERVGEGLGLFKFPNGIVVDGVGSKALVYVADGNNRRVQVFKTDGTFVRYINTSGTPRGLTFDSQGRLYVVDAIANRVDIYSRKGANLVGFGEAGAGPGQFAFPNDVSIDNIGRIFVTDRENNQVQVWGFRVAEIPGVTKVDRATWWLCLLPLPLLLLPLLLRRRRFVVTPDFVEAMIAAELVSVMDRRRVRWVIEESGHEAFQGRVVDGVDLGALLHPEPYSETDARDLSTRLAIPMQTAGLLALAARYKVLCTQDIELARMAVLLKVDAYDRDAWLARFAPRDARPRRGADD